MSCIKPRIAMLAMVSRNHCSHCHVVGAWTAKKSSLVYSCRFVSSQELSCYRWLYIGKNPKYNRIPLSPATNTNDCKKLIVLCVHTTKALLDLTSNFHLSIFAQNDDIAFSCSNVLVLTRFDILGEDTNSHQQISKVYKH